MTRSGISQQQIGNAFGQWQNAPGGSKGAVLKSFSQILGVGERQIRRLFVKYGYLKTTKSLIKKTPSKTYPHRKQWSEIVAVYKFSPPADEPPMVTIDAIETALLAGALPPEAKQVPERTFNRWLNDFGLIQKSKRARRTRSDQPNQVWHADASTSNHWHVAKQLPDGDYLLRFDPKKQGAYKNKAERLQKLRVWCYLAVDDCSSAQVGQFHISNGENSRDFLRFLDWAMARTDRSKSMPYGKPLNLLLDNGVVKRSLKGNDAFLRCGIGLPNRAPYNSRGGGRVERGFRTMWKRLESSFWPAVRAQKEAGNGPLTITLSELNKTLINYYHKINNKAHPTIAKQTKHSVWMKISHTGLIEIAPGALFNGFFQLKKHVEIDGTFKHKGATWSVIGFHDGHGHICEDVNGVITFVDLKGVGYHVEAFVEHPFGQYRAEKQSPLEKLDIPITANINSIYSNPETTMAHMAPRVVETTEADLPFTQPGMFANIDEATKYLIKGIGASTWRDQNDYYRTKLQEMLAEDLSINNADKLINRITGENYGILSGA